MLAGAGRSRAADVLRWPGMLGTEPLPLEELQAACRELLASRARGVQRRARAARARS